MKIMYDHQTFCRQVYGGISRAFYETALRLVELGNDVEIRAPLYVAKCFPANSPLTPQGIQIPKIPYSANLFTVLNNIYLSLTGSFNKGDADIYHETYFSKADNCPKSAVRFITVYDMITEKFPEMFSRFDYLSEAKKYSIQRADHILSISYNTKKDLMKYFGIADQKISVVHLGFMHRDITDTSFDIKLPKPYLLFVGGRQAYKNFDGLLKAYAASHKLKNNFCLLFFGGGEFNKYEKELISKLHLAETDIIHQSGNDAMLSYLYTNAAAFVYPSKYEGFGLPPLEAMSHGCPVLCSNTSSIPEVVGDAAEMFDPHSLESICSTLETVVFDSEILKNLIIKGYKRAKVFSWEKCASETLGVYKNILGHA